MKWISHLPPGCQLCIHKQDLKCTPSYLWQHDKPFQNISNEATESKPVGYCSCVALATNKQGAATRSDDWCCRRLHNEDKDPHRLLHRVPQLLRTGWTEIIIQQQQQEYLKATLKQQPTAGAGLKHFAFKKVILHTDFTSTCQNRNWKAQIK